MYIIKLIIRLWVKFRIIKSIIISRLNEERSVKRKIKNEY